MGSCSGGGDDGLHRAAAKEGAYCVRQAGVYGQVVHIQVSAAHTAGDVAEGDVGADGKAGQGEGSPDNSRIHHGLFHADQTHLLRLCVLPQLLTCKLCSKAGDDQGANDGVDQCIGRIHQIGDQIDHHGRGHGDPAGQRVLIDHAEGRLDQYEADAGHHGMNDGVPGEGGDGGKGTGKAQYHHDETAEHDHGKAFTAILSHASCHDDGLRLEGNGCYGVEGPAGHGTDGKADGGGYGSKSVGESQQTLGDAV